MSNSTRPSSSYDERFVVPLEASRRGAHRARVSPLVAMLPVVAVVGIVVAAIGLVYVFLGGAASDNPTTAAPSPTATAAPAATAPTQSGSGAAPGAAGKVDQTIVLDVFNGTSPPVSGLARRAGGRLESAGWTLGRVETWTGDAVTRTTVFYAMDKQKVSAQGVVRALGGGVVKLSPAKAGAGMAVVISNDYGGAAARAVATSDRSAGAETASPTGRSPARSTGGATGSGSRTKADDDREREDASNQSSRSTRTRSDDEASPSGN